MQPYFSASWLESAPWSSLSPQDRGTSAAGREAPLLPCLICLQTDSSVMEKGKINSFLLWIQKRTLY